MSQKIKLLVSMLSIFLFVACSIDKNSSEEGDITNENSQKVAFNLEDYAIFSAEHPDGEFLWPELFSESERFMPTEQDLEKGVKILQEHLENESKVEPLTEYQGQVFGFINEQNEKVLWINYFCSEKDYWKESLVFVFDGGNCYFNVKINIDKEQIFDLMVNGHA